MVDQRLKIDITGRNRTGAAFRSLRADVSRTTAVMSRFTKGFAGGFIGGAAIAAFTNPIRSLTDALDDFDKLSKRARQSGVTGEFFQTLQFAAEEANFSQETLNRSFLAFNKRLGEARAGTGPLVASLKFLDAELLQQLETSTSTEEAMRILSDRLASIEDPAKRAAIASAAFSRAGIEMVEVLGNGSRGLDDTARKARSLGIVISDELLSRAEQLNNDYGVAARVIDLEFKRALVELSPAIVKVAQGISSVAGVLGSVTQAVKSTASFWDLLAEGTKKNAENISSLTDDFLDFLGLKDDVAAFWKAYAEGARLTAQAIGLIKPTIETGGGKGDFLGLPVNRPGGGIGSVSHDPSQFPSGDPLSQVLDVAQENSMKPLILDMQALGREAELTGAKIRQSVQGAFDQLRFTGNDTIDGLLSKLLELAAVDILGGQQSGNSFLGGLSGNLRTR